MPITYHEPHLYAAQLAGGITPEECDAHSEKLKIAYQTIQKQKKDGELGFALLPYDTEAVQAVQDLAQELRGKFTQIVVVGIGGSDLGARAAFRALKHQFHNENHDRRGEWPQLLFTGDTTDPLSLSELMDGVDWQGVGIVMISKSGNTIEQMSTFLILRDRLIRAVGKERAREQIIAITDAEGGTLRDLTNQEGYRSLAIPAAAGGRFSVLSAVGLFPLAMVGVDIQSLLLGARDLDRDETADPSAAAQFAFAQYVACVERGQHISIMFPYSYALREFGFWFRQLWAESLGKKVDLDGREVHVGPTPIAAVGPTDQHSQVQLYMEGPNDKILTFIRVKEATRDITIPTDIPKHDGVAYLAGLSMHSILWAEQEATAEALASAGRPSLVLEVDRLDAYHLGQLFYFFELATAYAGLLWNINAYDQPGVELGKQIMFKKLGRQGY